MGNPMMPPYIRKIQNWSRKVTELLPQATFMPVNLDNYSAEISKKYAEIYN